MPALISITKVRLGNLPAAAQGTLGVVRVKFRAGTAAAETIPRRVNPDGSVEWLETLEMIVHDTSVSVSLVAVVTQENSSGGWSLVPGGRFEGALVTELPTDWHGASSVPTDPTFHAQLSVEIEDGTQRDTRLPPQAGMNKSGAAGFRPSPPPAGTVPPVYQYGLGPFARAARGGRGTAQMDRAVSGDSSGMPFGAAYGMGAPSGSSGYVDAIGSPEVFFDARSGDSAGAGVGAGVVGALGGASMDRSSSSGASSLGGGFVTATAVAVPATGVPADADGISPSEAPMMRRASTYSASSSSTYSVPPARGVPPARRSSKKRYPGGWVQSGSQDGSFRSSVRMSMSDVSSFSEGSGSFAPAPAEAEETAPPAPGDAPFPSPVGKHTYSRLLDDRFELEEEGRAQERKAEQGLEEDEYSFGGPAFKRPSLTDARPGLGAAFEPAAQERRYKVERVEEVKTQRRSGDDDDGVGMIAVPIDGKKSWFQLRRKAKATRSRGRGDSSTDSGAAGSSETRSFPDGEGRAMSMSFSSTASAAEAEEKEELEPSARTTAAAAAPPAAAAAPAPPAAKWKKAGRTTGALRKSFSLLKRKEPPPPSFMRGPPPRAAAAPPPPSAPPAAGAPPTKLVEPSDLSDRRASSLERPPPTAPPSYEEVMRQRGLLPRPGGAAPASALHPELAMSRSRSSSSEPAAAAAAGAAAESPVGGRVLPQVPTFPAAASFSPSAPAAPEEPGPGWDDGGGYLAEPSSVDDEAAAAVAAVAMADASQQQEEVAADRSRGEREDRDWKDECLVEALLQGAAAPGAAVAAAPPPPVPPRPLPAASSETGDESSDSGLVRFGRVDETRSVAEQSVRPGWMDETESVAAQSVRPGWMDETESVAAQSVRPGWMDGTASGRGEDGYSAENLYDTGVALGGRPVPEVAAASVPEEIGGLPVGEEEVACEEPLPVYSAMPADSLDGSGRFDAPVDSDSLTLYPSVRPRQQQLEPSESRTTTASEVTGVEPGFSGTRPRQMVPSRLPPESTSVSSESTSIAGNMSLQGGNTRAVPPAPAPRPRLRQRSMGAGGGRDPVVFSCFAPSAVKPGIAFDLQLKAYLTRERDTVLRESLRDGAVERGRPEGMSIAKGKRVTVELLLPEDKFKIMSMERIAGRPSVRDFVWNGEPTGAEFRVGCLPGIDPGKVKCEALVIEGSRVKRLSFDIEVAAGGDFVPRALESGPNGEVELDTVMKDVESNMAEVPFEELEFVGELGQGVQGFTSHYRWRDKDVAVKSLSSYPDFYPSNGPTRNGLKHEATILSLLGHHPNVVEFYGLCRQGDEGIHIVTKLEEGGSIEGALGLKRKGNGGSANGGGRFAANGGSNGNGRGHGHGYGSEFDGQARAVWARDIACGLANSHSAGVLHNDVASRNALLSSTNPDSRALLCDFGLSKFLRDGLQRAYCIDTQMDHERWPIRQMPCESLVHPYSLTAESDSWMYGIFLYELFAGEQPWAGLDKHEVKRLVMEGKRPPKVPEMLKDRGTHLVKLYDGCLSKDSEKRPSLEHVVRELSTNFASMSASWGNGNGNGNGNGYEPVPSSSFPPPEGGLEPLDGVR